MTHEPPHPRHGPDGPRYRATTGSDLSHNTLFGSLFDLCFKLYLASKTYKALPILAIIVAGCASVALLIWAFPISSPLARLGLTVMFPMIFPATVASFWGLI